MLEEKHYERLLIDAYEATSESRVRDLRREAPTPAEGGPSWIVRALVEVAKLPSEPVFVTAPGAAASTEPEAVLVELKLTPL